MGERGGRGVGGVLYRLKISSQNQSNPPIDWSLVGASEPSMNSIFISLLDLFPLFKMKNWEMVACALLVGRIQRQRNLLSGKGKRHFNAPKLKTPKALSSLREPHTSLAQD